MSVLRIVTRILPTGAEHQSIPHLLDPSEIGEPVSREWSRSDPFVAETTFCKENLLPPGADADDCAPAAGLVCLKKSRLRLSSEPPQPSLVRICPERLPDGSCGGVLLSIPLRISRAELAQPPRHPERSKGLKSPRKRFKCGTCKRYFASKGSWAVHRKYHMRQYACDICGMRFKFRQHLKNHSLKFHQVADES